MRDYLPYTFILLALAALLDGCSSNPEIYNTTYAEQITLFVNEDKDGKELFSPELYSDSSFTIDESDQKYFYEVDSTYRRITIVVADTGKKIEPYESIYDAVAIIDDEYYGDVRRIYASGDTLDAYPFESYIRRYAYFLKLFNDGYQYHGWRFWGYYSEGYLHPLNINRWVMNSTGQKRISAQGQSDSVPDPMGRYDYGENYIFFDTIPIFGLGERLTYRSTTNDRIFVRISENNIDVFETVKDFTFYKTEWDIAPPATPFNRLILVEKPWEDDFIFKVYINPNDDTDTLGIDTSLVKFSDYVVFYKTQ